MHSNCSMKTSFRDDFHSSSEDSFCSCSKFIMDDDDFDMLDDGFTPDFEFNEIICEKYSYYSQISKQ